MLRRPKHSTIEVVAPKEEEVYYKAVSQHSSFLMHVCKFIFFHQFIQVLKDRTQNAVLTTDQHIT
jgi:hypothetical protein